MLDIHFRPLTELRIVLKYETAEPCASELLNLPLNMSFRKSFRDTEVKEVKIGLLAEDGQNVSIQSKSISDPTTTYLPTGAIKDKILHLVRLVNFPNTL